MEPKPKERIVFDEDSYYGDEGEKMAINDLMERDGLTEYEVREDFTDDEIFNHQMEMKDFDFWRTCRRPSRVLPPCGVLRYLAGCRPLPGRAVRLSLLHDRPA